MAQNWTRSAQWEEFHREDYLPGPVSSLVEWEVQSWTRSALRVVFRLAEDEDEAVALTDNAIQNRFAHLIGIQTGPVPILQRSTYTCLLYPSPSPRDS